VPSTTVTWCFTNKKINSEFVLLLVLKHNCRLTSDVNTDLGPKAKDTGHKVKTKALGYQGQGLGSQGQGQGLEMSKPITKTEGQS